ncbi:MAG: GNAT family N-acetyltransferase [Saprospiraceae bacterium]
MKIQKTYTIETENLLLRIPNESDIPYIFSATRVKGFNDGMQWNPPEKLTDLLAPLKHNHQAWESGEGFGFTITKKGFSMLIGRISIRKTSETNVWNIGFWTHPDAQNQGIMTEAVSGILRFGFEILEAVRIEACYAIWNKASEKVMLKNGMKHVQFIEKGFQKNGKWISENLMAITRNFS